MAGIRPGFKAAALLLMCILTISVPAVLSGEGQGEAPQAPESADGVDDADGHDTAGHDAAVVPIEGDIDPFQVVFLRRSIEKAKEAGAETIIFSINTFGGRVDSALQMATLIGSLRDIETIAFVPAEPESVGAVSYTHLRAHET